MNSLNHELFFTEPFTGPFIQFFTVFRLLSTWLARCTNISYRALRSKVHQVHRVHRVGGNGRLNGVGSAVFMDDPRVHAVLRAYGTLQAQQTTMKRNRGKMGRGLQTSHPAPPSQDTPFGEAVHDLADGPPRFVSKRFRKQSRRSRDYDDPFGASNMQKVRRDAAAELVNGDAQFITEHFRQVYRDKDRNTRRKLKLKRLKHGEDWITNFTSKEAYDMSNFGLKSLTRVKARASAKRRQKPKKSKKRVSRDYAFAVDLEHNKVFAVPARGGRAMKAPGKRFAGLNRTHCAARNIQRMWRGVLGRRAAEERADIVAFSLDLQHYGSVWGVGDSGWVNV